jgi:hypothetical protein
MLSVYVFVGKPQDIIVSICYGVSNFKIDCNAFDLTQDRAV